MRSIELFFPVVLCIILYKVVLIFQFVYEILLTNITICLLTDESWDIDSPQSPSRSADQDDDNNNQTFDGRPNAGPQTQSSEARKDEQDQNLSEVHDFFDS